MGEQLNLPVFSTSLDPKSKSRQLAVRAVEHLRAAGHTSELIDLTQTPLAPFDNYEVFQGPAYESLHQMISAADAIVLAAPIYNWSIGSTAKGFVEATGATGENGRRAAWFDKVVTFLFAGGLPHSYMAFNQIASSMMLDFKCVINPYALYVSARDWQAIDTLSADRTARLTKTLDVHAELASLLKERSYRSDWEV